MRPMGSLTVNPPGRQQSSLAPFLPLLALLPEMHFRWRSTSDNQNVSQFLPVLERSRTSVMPSPGEVKSRSSKIDTNRRQSTPSDANRFRERHRLASTGVGWCRLVSKKHPSIKANATRFIMCLPPFFRFIISQARRQGFAAAFSRPPEPFSRSSGPSTGIRISFRRRNHAAKGEL